MTLNLSMPEALAISAALFAIFMVGTGNLRVNLFLYGLQISLLAATTAAYAPVFGESQLYLLAATIFLVKGVGVPVFLSKILGKINVFSDSGTVLPLPIAMHASIVLLGVSQLLASHLTTPGQSDGVVGSVAAAVSLLLTGAMFMLTRKTAVCQVVGFLTMESGIYLVALTLAQGMPLIVEMGILLDVLVGVMIAGLITFRIQKSFEHIDVTRLTDLHD